jgi:hypothetical protein
VQSTQIVAWIAPPGAIREERRVLPRTRKDRQMMRLQRNALGQLI